LSSEFHEGDPPMDLCLAIRTWAALDLGLDFFRQAPEEIRAGRVLSRHCRALRRRLRQAGLHADYRAVGTTAFGKPVQRLLVTGPLRAEDTLTINFRRETAACLAQACLMLIEVQADATLEPLLDYEAEEVLAARAFLTALRGSGLKLADVAGKRPLRWHRASGQYLLPPLLAARMHQHYRRAGAGLN
jgi:hypothetical protein